MNKKTVRFLGCVLLAACATTIPAFATTYYINNAAGSGCSDGSGYGTSTSKPWCDFNVFNTTTFNPGDIIYLESGDTWNQAVTLLGSGSSGSPITLTSYGSGAKPKIEYGGSTPGTAVLSGTNLSYWTISGLEIEDTSTVAFDPTFTTATSQALSLFYTGAPTYSGITISNNTLHGTNTGTNNYVLSIYASYSSRSTDAVDNITINDNTIYDGGMALVSISGAVNGAQMTYYTGGGYGNLQFHGNTVYNSALQGVLIAAALSSSAIYDNLVHDTGLWTGADSGWGPVALWTLGSNNIFLYDNEVYNSGSANTNYDSGGIDIDWDNSYVTAYGNYLHGNTGPGVEVLSSDHTTIEWNRIFNNKESTENEPAQIALEDYAGGYLHGITNANVYGNVIVLENAGDTALSTYGSSGYTWSGDNFSSNLVEFVNSTSAYKIETDGYGPIATATYNQFEDASGAAFTGNYDGANYTSLSAWVTGTGLDATGSNSSNVSGWWEAWADFAPPGHTSNGWSYNYSTNNESSYTAATWDTSAENDWLGNESYCGIYTSPDPNVGYTPAISPGGGSCDAVLTWTAPSSSYIYIGAVQNIAVWAGGTGCGGEGVKIRILNGTTQIWPSSGWETIANGGSYTFPGWYGAVSSGNTVNFVVAHNGSNNYCDHVSWDPAIGVY